MIFANLTKMAIFDQIALSKASKNLQNLSTSGDDFIYSCLEWHTTSKLLAVGRRRMNSEQGEIVFFQSDGNQCHSNATDASAQSSSYPVAVAFHPIIEYIVCAWSDGMLSAMHTTGNTINNDKPALSSAETGGGDVHVLEPQGSAETRITAIWWSQHGQAFVTAGADGNMSVWLVSENAITTSTVVKRVPRKLATFRLSPAVAHVAFIENRYSSIQQTPIHGVPLGIKPTTPPKQAGDGKGSQRPLVEFIAITTTNALFYCSDTTQKQLAQLEVNVLCVTMQPNASTAGGRGLKLSVAGADFTVREWKLTVDPLQLTDTNTLRLSSSSTTSARENDRTATSEFGSVTGSCIVPLENDVWATAIGERLVRIWDFKRNINALLKLDAFSNIQLGEVVQKIRYARHSGMLVGITNFGSLVMWRKAQSSSSSANELDGAGSAGAGSVAMSHQNSNSNLNGWEVLSSVQMKGVVIRQLHLHTAMLIGIINGSGDRDAWILKERSIVKTFLYPLAAIQTSAHTILLENVESSAVDVVDIEDNKPIASLALSASHLVVGYADSSLSSYVWRSEADKKRILTTLLRTYDETFDFIALCNDSIVLCTHEGGVRLTTVNGAQIRAGVGYAVDDSLKSQPSQLLLMKVQTECSRLLCVYDNVRVCITDLGGQGTNRVTCVFGELDVAERLQLPSVHASGATADDTRGFAKSSTAASSNNSNLMIKLADLDATGKRVAFCCTSPTDGKQQTMLYVWDAEFDSLLWFDLNASSVTNSFAVISYHCPDQLAWQDNYPQFLIVSSRAIADLPFPSSAKERARIVRRPRVNVFIIPPANKQQLDNMLILSSSETLASSDTSTFLGARLPYVYLCRKPRGENSSLTANTNAVRRLTESRVLRDFQQHISATPSSDSGQPPASLDAIIKFTYHIALGQVEEAVNSVKGMRSESTWQHLATHCVREGKLEYAQMCLGQMRNAFAVCIMQQADFDAKTTSESGRRLLKLGHAALALNMTQEAEQFWRLIDRHDLICRLKMTQGEWDEAFEVSFSRNRILQPLVHYKMAEQSLVLANSMDDAIPHFEASHAGVLRIPRALAAQQDFQALDKFVQNHKENAEICRWYANYLESRGQLDEAIEWYGNAQDHASVIRLYCNSGQSAKAIELVERTNNAAAAFQLAERLDRDSDDTASANSEQVLHFYGIAKAYWHALQYCKKHDFLDQLVNFALLGPKSDMLEAAQFLEDRFATSNTNTAHKDKLVLLYQKAGYVERAVELAFENEMYHSIDVISAELDQFADKHLVKRCADFFLAQKQLNRAVGLFARTGNYDEAIAMCARNRVRLTEELVALLVPPPASDEQISTGDAVPVSAEHRRELLRQLAELCSEQSLFAIAARLYGEASKPVDAAKALIQLTSADGTGVEQLVRFARTSRNEQVYVLVANFLQRLWTSGNRSLEQPIVFFYKKARASLKLVAFYNTQAETFIEEEANYDKAREVLLSCEKELQTLLSTSSDDKIQAVAARVRTTVQNINRYIALDSLVKRTVAGESESSGQSEVHQQQQAVSELRELLQESDWHRGVRTHHVLVLAILWAAHGRNWRVAHQALERLRTQSPSHVPAVTQLLEPALVEQIYKQVSERVPPLRRREEPTAPALDDMADSTEPVEDDEAAEDEGVT